MTVCLFLHRLHFDPLAAEDDFAVFPLQFPLGDPLVYPLPLLLFYILSKFPQLQSVF